MKLWARQLAFGLLLTAAIPSAAVRAADSAEQILLDTANYWRLKDRPDLARESLDKLLTLNPNQPDALYQYGALELQQGNLAGARTYLARLQQVAPGDVRVADLAASVKAGKIDPRRVNEARRIAAGGDNAPVVQNSRAPSNRMAAPVLRTAAPAAAARGDATTARTKFQEAVAADPKNPWIRLDFARFLAKQGAAAQGFATVDPAASGNTPASLQAAAIYDSEQHRPADALAKLDRIPADARTADISRLRGEILVAGSLQRAKMLAGAGKLGDARRLLVALFDDPALTPGDRAGVPRLLAALGDVAGAAQLEALNSRRFGDGIGLGSGTSTPPPNDPQSVIPGASATLAAAAGGSAPLGSDPAVMPAPLEATAKSADSDDLTPTGVPEHPTRTAAGRQDGGAPRRLQLASLPTDVISATDAGPNGPVPAAPAPIVPAPPPAAAIVKPREHVAQAELTIPSPIGGYQPPVENGTLPEQDSLELDIERSMAEIQAETSPVLEAGLVYRGREGQSGLSQLNEIAAPIDGRFSPWLTGTMDVLVSPIYLDAGPVGSTALPLFGANPILQAGGAALVPAGAQNTAGVMTALGYSFGPFSAKVGDVGWGFPVNNVIGNIAYQPKFLNDTLSFRIEGLRQPVTDSLLSYAGTHASLGAANAATGGAFGTNGTWGGVVKSGGRGSVFYDDNNIGAFGTVGFAALTGDNVPENNTIDAVAGAYFRPYRGDNDAVRVGINLNYFGFNRNLSYYTYGQGGYFSPQNYEAITFPVEYQGRSGRWSYLGAVALGVQHFNQDQSAFFPDNSAAQAALVALVGPGSAVYPSHVTTGLAADVRAQAEYAIADDLAVGVSGSFDNGHSYNEGIVKLYIRKTFSNPPQVTAILPGTPMAGP